MSDRCTTAPNRYGGIPLNPPVPDPPAHPLSTLHGVSLLVRREIEARIVSPLTEALIPACGRDRVLSTLRGVVEALGEEAGREAAGRFGGDTLAHLQRAIALWTQDQALDLGEVTLSGEHFFFDVHRCRYAEMYGALGLRDLGEVLSCGRDVAFARGFNPRLRLLRTRTLMAGQGPCDFRFFLESGGPECP